MITPAVVTNTTIRSKASGGMPSIFGLAAVCFAMATFACGGGPASIPSTPTPATPSPAPPAPTVPPPEAVPAREISIGEVVHASVTREDPICDPIHWDAHAPCKRFFVRATHSGTLRVRSTVNSNDEYDTLLDCPTGGDYSGAWNQVLTQQVSAGDSCFITINWYPYVASGSERLDFELTASL